MIAISPLIKKLVLGLMPTHQFIIAQNVKYKTHYPQCRTADMAGIALHAAQAITIQNVHGQFQFQKVTGWQDEGVKITQPSATR
jgi:hypothetical protein